MWSSPKRLVTSLSILLLLGFSGCGYTLRHRLKDTFSGPRGIFVPVFDNHTDEVGAERVFTNALVRELQSRGEVVMSSRKADGLELKGDIIALDIAPTALSDRAMDGLAGFRRLPSELGVTVLVKLTLTDPNTGKLLWANVFRGFRRVEAPLDRTRNYTSPSALGPITQSIVESRFADIARDLMRDVYDEMVELF